jgi:3-hydroxy-9,10-secoandrosta-1,3,5(10)-triene-9,17-dione monooxygenase
VLTSTSFNPAGGKVSLAEGGYRVSGRWDFASGCDEAGWVLLVGNGPEGLLWLLLPRRDYAIEDTWFVSGLRGTGSKDVVIEDVFVPQRHTLQVAEIREARTPGRDLHDTANYRIPLRSLLSFTLVAPVLGMAQGMLEAFEANTLRGLASRRANRLMEIPGLQMRLAEASAEIRAAGLLMRHDCRELFARARRGEMPTLEERARYRLDQSYVARLCARAVDRLFAASGGHALMDSSPMQRFHRDVHAAANHISLSWDATAIQYGGIRLGVEVREPDL